MRRALSTASLGLLRGASGVVGDVFIDQGIDINEQSEDVSFFDSDQLNLSISDQLTMVEITANKTNIQINQNEDDVDAE